MVRVWIECVECDEKTTVWMEIPKHPNTEERWRGIDWRGVKEIRDFPDGWVPEISSDKKSIIFMCPKHKKRKA